MENGGGGGGHHGPCTVLSMDPSCHLSAPDDRTVGVMVQALIGGTVGVGARAHAVSPSGVPPPDINQPRDTNQQVALTDANGQGTLSMGRDQLREFRDKPLAAAAAANRTQVPACNMKLRYAPLLELSDDTRIHGATLVVIKPVGDAAGVGGGRKELDKFVAGTFDGPFREAVAALSKRRTYLLEMNGF